MKLALGTAQFGLDYGVTNEDGKITENEAKRIFEAARRHDIQLIDTASAYGDSETVLGRITSHDPSIGFITKFSELSKSLKNIRQVAQQSLSNLQCPTLYGLLFHSESDLLSDQGEEYFRQLLVLKDQGIVRNIGGSFYTLKALEKALSTYDMDLIQIPANCLDQRFQQSGLLTEAKNRGIEIHARSIFLQGLLIQRSAHLPAAIKRYRHHLSRYFDEADRLNISPLQLALKYLLQTNEIDIGVVGCQNEQQFVDIINAYKHIQNMHLSIDFSELSVTEEALLNPSIWS